MKEALKQARKEMLELSGRLYELGIMTGLEGNYSCRYGEHILISAKGKKYFNLKEEDFLLCTRDGEVLDGEGIPSSGLEMHQFIYSSRSDVNCVVHTHSIAATSFSISGLSIPNSLEVLRDFAGGEIPVTKTYAPLGTPELAKEIKNAMTESYGVLLRNHGVLTYGRSIEHAMFVAWSVEMAAKMVINAKVLGNVETIPSGGGKK